MANTVYVFRYVFPNTAKIDVQFVIVQSCSMCWIPQEGFVDGGTIVNTGGSDHIDRIVVFNQVPASTDITHLHKVRNVYRNGGTRQIEHGRKLALRKHWILCQFFQNQPFVFNHDWHPIPVSMKHSKYIIIYFDVSWKDVKLHKNIAIQLNNIASLH